MISVPAHPVDLERLRQLAPDLHGRLDMLRTRVPELKPFHLANQISGVRHDVDLLVRAEPEWPELVTWAKFLARGTAAMFTYARRRERDRWRLLDGDQRLVGDVPADFLRSGYWLSGFWFAFATFDAESLALLAQGPADEIAEWEAYDRPLVGAYQSLFARAPGTGDRILEALRLADPDKVTRTDPDSVLDIVVPEIECLVALADRDAARFEAAVRKKLELARDYHIRNHRDGTGGAGNLSGDALGLLAWARALGIDVEVDSPYVPRTLLALPMPDVTACPRCATPAEADCHGCGYVLHDDALSFGFAEWLALDRDACGSCGHRFPVLAKTCPVCLTVRA